jgi:D-alanyl-D-alanine dipeptidase
MSPVSLVPVDLTIASSYNKSGGTGGPRANLTPLAKLGKAGIAHPEVAPALKALSDAVSAAGGDFRITECHRDVNVQKNARQKYDNWVQAGKPAPGSAGWNAATMKNAFVALPGRSGHNAGRSIDVHLSELRFPGVPANQQLDKLWEIAIPLGWKPVIKTADEGAKEAWHFDFWGELTGVLNRLGYEQAALCGALLVGHGDLQGFPAVTQALLCRAGFDIGKIDGAIGPKSIAALASALRIPEADAKNRVTAQDVSMWPALLSLPAK